MRRPPAPGQGAAEQLLCVLCLLLCCAIRTFWCVTLSLQGLPRAFPFSIQQAEPRAKIGPEDRSFFRVGFCHCLPRPLPLSWHSVNRRQMILSVGITHQRLE